MVDHKHQLISKFEEKTALAGVIGLGYVGLPLVVEVAKAGYRVLGVDVNTEVVAKICRGESHIQDIPSALLAPLVKNKVVSATTDSARLGECDAISICVPTPLNKTKDPDVSYVLAATESVRKVLRRGQLVVLESTTYPGTTRELMLPALEATGLKVGEDFFLAFSGMDSSLLSTSARIFRHTPSAPGGSARQTEA